MDETKRVGYQTDQAMKMTWLALCDDFCISGFQPMRAALARGDTRAFRELLNDARTPMDVSPAEFKKVVQLKEWFKRYRCANDLFTDEQLAQVSWKNYSETQNRCAIPIRVDIFYRSGLVHRWRQIAASILGDYTESEHFERCMFARNACVGHPSRRKGLDQKLKGPFTGSMEHIRFLQRYAETDPTLADILQENGSPFHPAPSLRLTFVPKSYKALRAIMPDTLAGSFYSSGLGEMIKARLAKSGLNINTLQRRHRKLAMKASRPVGWGRGSKISASRRLATVDLSSASDSITTQLLSMILPRKWFHAITKGRISYYDYNKKRYRLVSACTMGLGHTFPLETLVFYVLTKGVAEWYGPEASSAVSVYGDDIIVPTEVLCGNGTFPSLTQIFRRLHLVLNDQKSFWGWCDFRESCGGDFYRGHDVRPASPQGASCTLSKTLYITFLYKLANLLLRRWSPNSIETTLAWITSEIYLIDGVVLAVPESYPDTSGLKVEPGTFFTSEPKTINFGSKVVEFYQIDLPFRRCFYEKALLWAKLRASADGVVQANFLASYERPPGLAVRTRRVRTKKGYRTISYLVLTNPSASGRPKLVKSICPNWVIPSSGCRA